MESQLRNVKCIQANIDLNTLMSTYTYIRPTSLPDGITPLPDEIAFISLSTAIECVIQHTLRDNTFEEGGW